MAEMHDYEPRFCEHPGCFARTSYRISGPGLPRIIYTCHQHAGDPGIREIAAHIQRQGRDVAEDAARAGQGEG
jgi:hypothetical protein